MTDRIVYRWPDGAYLYLSATDPDPAEGWQQVSKTQWRRPLRTDQQLTDGHLHIKGMG